MTEVISTKCDGCNVLVDEEVVMTTGTSIAHCYVCDKDYCNYCAETHAQEETGLYWK
jgi:hypothetical protein